MRIAICSKKKKEIKNLFLNHGFKIVEKNPEIVISYGGDGTVLFSERKFPSVPKLIIKDVKISKVIRKYDVSSLDIEKVLEKIKQKNFKIIEEMKLEASFKGKKLIGLNEIQIHNKLPTKAIRFSLQVNRKLFENLIGDGVIISTPFGSTAYYSSAGGKKFKRGIGIAFNNLYSRKIKSFVIPENSKIKIGIIRGPALLIADNYEKFIELKDGDEIIVKKSPQKAKFIYIAK